MLRHIYVAGSMRSGTTLVGEMLGSAEGAVCIGETTLLWQALRRDDRCSCGKPATGCPLWSAVLSGLAGLGVGRQALAGVQADVLRIVRTRRLARLWRQAHQPRRRPPEVNRVLDALACVSSTAAARLGVDAIVDTTKHTPGLVLRAMTAPDELDVVHVVRDPRGVVASNLRSLSDLRREDEPHARPPVRATAVWSVENVLLSTVGPHLGRYQQVAYESVAADPAGTLDGWATTLSLAWPDDVVSGSSFAVRHSHVLVGNPTRMGGDVRQLRVDDRWRRDLPDWQQRAITAGTALPAWLTRAAAAPRRSG